MVPKNARKKPLGTLDIEVPTRGQSPQYIKLTVPLSDFAVKTSVFVNKFAIIIVCSAL